MTGPSRTRSRPAFGAGACRFQCAGGVDDRNTVHRWQQHRFPGIRLLPVRDDPRLGSLRDRSREWAELIVNLAAVPLVAAAQIAVTPSGSLTSNVQTSLQALDAGKSPTSHTHVSSAISDSTTVGRALLTAPDVATQNALLGTTTLGFQPGNIKETAGILLESGWYWCDGSNKNRVTDAALFNAITIQQSGVLNSTAVVTGLSDTSNMSPGMPMSGIGVPASTVVQPVDSSTQVTMSANARVSATTPLVFAPYGVGGGTPT